MRAAARWPHSCSWLGLAAEVRAGAAVVTASTTGVSLPPCRQRETALLLTAGAKPAACFLLSGWRCSGGLLGVRTGPGRNPCVAVAGADDDDACGCRFLLGGVVLDMSVPCSGTRGNPRLARWPGSSGAAASRLPWRYCWGAMEATGIVAGGGGLVEASARIGAMCVGDGSCCGHGSRGAMHAATGFPWMTPSSDPAGSLCSLADS